MRNRIYADNAATTALDVDAFEAMKPYLLDEYGNASQPYFFSRKPKRALKEARATIASCLGAQPEEIFFTSGGTESDNWAIKCFGAPSDVRTIFTSQIEHRAVLNACDHQFKHSKCTVIKLPVDSEGIVSPSVLHDAMIEEVSNRDVISCETKLVSIMLANNEIGTIEPIKELAEIAHKHRAIFHTDAVQAVGHIPIDVQALGVDLLSASAHKFNGPKGIGFLYVRKGTLLFPYLNGGAQEREMRAGTENVASIVGMAVALKNNCDAIEQNRERIQKLENLLISLLDESGIQYSRNGGHNKLPGLLSLSFPGKDAEALLHRMDLMGICISTGAACNSVHTEVSHVLKAIKLEDNLAKGTIRISLGKNNSTDDVYSILLALKKILSSE